jgi:hypothetical protein
MALSCWWLSLAQKRSWQKLTGTRHHLCGIGSALSATELLQLSTSSDHGLRRLHLAKRLCIATGATCTATQHFDRYQIVATEVDSCLYYKLNQLPYGIR